ncbi:MAG TPA: Nif3-like dinuclear metal center hexameric protein [bacterium]|jgi:hypothetical protein|nr:Nif3-like dinuclear metal center hexameric protein [bacterium]
MTTDEIMALALEMAGFPAVPEDSGIFVEGRDIRRVLFGVDVGPAELQLARSLGMDLVIAHHPPSVARDGWKVYLRHVEFMTASGGGACATRWVRRWRAPAPPWRMWSPRWRRFRRCVRRRRGC